MTARVTKYVVRQKTRPLLLPASWGCNAAIYRACAGRYSHRTIQRFRRDGLTAVHADNLACALGYHPFDVWGQSYFDAEDLYASEGGK